MKIEVMGTGCAKCRTLAAHAREAAEALSLEYELDHVTELNELIRRGVMITPALWVDGREVLRGRSASVEELRRLLQATAG